MIRQLLGEKLKAPRKHRRLTQSNHCPKFVGALNTFAHYLLGRTDDFPFISLVF